MSSGSRKLSMNTILRDARIFDDVSNFSPSKYENKILL